MSNHILTNDNYDRHSQRNQWANDNKHICLLPYTSLQFFHSSKYVSPCCNLRKTDETDYLKPIVQLKEAISNKQTFKNCSVCYKCEAEGKISERTRYLIELTNQQLDSFLEKQEVPGFNIHCTLSNKCNMACRSCNINTSSLFAKIETGIEIKTPTISDDMSYWNTMLESITRAVAEKNQINLIISGGEGFVQSDFKLLIKHCIENNLSKQINLTVNTNGIVDNETFIQYLCDNFNRVSLAVSVDSIYENYHYVRWPGTWNKIEENLETFANYQNTKDNFNFFLTPVWSINNIFYVEDWIRYFENFKTKFDLPYFFAYDTPLFQPVWLDVLNMPDYLKTQAALSLNNILDNSWLKTNKTLHANIINLSNLLTKPENDKTHWHYYLKKTAEWDKKTGASAEIYNAKLYQLLNDSDKSLFQKYLITQNNL